MPVNTTRRSKETKEEEKSLRHIRAEVNGTDIVVEAITALAGS